MNDKDVKKGQTYQWFGSKILILGYTPGMGWKVQMLEDGVGEKTGNIVHIADASVFSKL